MEPPDSLDAATVLELPDLTNQPTPLELCKKGQFTELFALYDSLAKCELKIKGYQPSDELEVEIKYDDNFDDSLVPKWCVSHAMYQPIHFAAAHGNLEALRELVDKYKCLPDSAGKESDRRKLRRFSAPFKLSTCFDYLDNMDGRIRRFSTPLTIATYYGHFDIVEYLINVCNCHPRADEHYYLSSYVISVDRFSGYISTINAFVDIEGVMGSDHVKIMRLFLQQNEKIRPSLLNAAKILMCRGSFSDLTKLHDYKNLINEGLNDPNQNMLAMAFHGNNVAIVQEILNNGLLPLSTKVMHCAATCASDEMLALLIEGCSTSTMVEEIPPEPNRIYHVYTRKFSLLQLITMRVNNLSSIFLSDALAKKFGYVLEKTGTNFLHYACLEGSLLLARSLQKYPHLQNMKDSNGRLPLHIACAWHASLSPNAFDMIQVVSNSCEIIDSQDHDGNTALHLACIYVNWKAVDYLINSKRAFLSLFLSNSEGLLPVHIFICNFSLFPLRMNIFNNNTVLPYRMSVFDQDAETIFFLLNNFCYILQDKYGNTPLHAACFSYINTSVKEKIVQHLVKNAPSSVRIVNNHGDLPIHIAMEQGTKGKSLINLLLRGIDVNVQNAEGNTPLHLACLCGSENAVAYLIKEKCAYIMVQNNNGELPLHSILKSKCQNLYIIDLLISDDCLFVQDNSGNTPLHIACSHQFDFILAKILLLMTTNYANCAFLCRPCEFNSLTLKPYPFTLLFAKNNCNDSPFQLLLNAKHPMLSTVISVLLSLVYFISDNPIEHFCGAFSNSLRLHYWVENMLNNMQMSTLFDQPSDHPRALEIFKQLVTPLNMRYRDDKGQTVLHLIFGKTCSIDILKLIPFTGEDVISPDNSGQTPLHLVCKWWKDRESLEYLFSKINPIQAMIITDLQDNAGYTPLYYACMNSFDLTYFPAPISCDDLKMSGSTLLHVASQQRNLENVKHLLKCSSPNSLKQKDKLGNLPLHYACTSSLEMVKLFGPITMEDLHTLNNDGFAPVHLAIESNRVKIVEYLCLVHDNTVCQYQCVVEKDIFMHLFNSAWYSYKGLFEEFLVYRSSFDEMLKYLATHQLTIDFASGKHREVIIRLACKVGFLESEKYMTKDDTFIVSDCSLRKPPYSCIDRTSLLHAAAWYGRTDILHYLIIEEKCDLTITGKNGENALVYACKFSDYFEHAYYHGEFNDDSLPSVDSISFLIDCGCSIFYKFGFHQTIFKAVCRKKDILLFKALFASPSTVNLQDHEDDYNTPLMLLFKYCDHQDTIKFTVEAARFLIIDCKCNQALTNRSHHTALELACQKDALIDIVKLMDLPADIESTLKFACGAKCLSIIKYLMIETNNISQNSMIHLLNASWNGYLLHTNIKHDNVDYLLNHVSLECILQNGVFMSDDLVEYCIRNGYQLERNLQCKLCHVKMDSFGNTLLHIAVIKNYVDIVEDLSRQADVDKTRCNDDMDTPLLVACSCKNLKMVQFLPLDCIDVPNASGNTPLHIACLHGAYDIVNYLLEHFSKVSDNIILSSQNASGDTLLHITSQHGAYDIIDQYSSKVIEMLSSRNKSGYLPAQIALQKFENESTTSQRLETLFKLVKLTSNIVSNNLLHVLCQKDYHCYLKFAQYLVQTHAESLDSEDNLQKLPLHYACSVSIDLVKLCVSPNMVNHQDIHKNTPMHIACAHGNYDIINYLMKCVDVSLQNQKGRTPLHELCASDNLCGSMSSMIPLFIQKRSYVVDDSDNYPLHLLCKTFRNDKLEVFIALVEALKKNNFKHTFSKKNEYGELPLHHLCKSRESSSCDAIQILVSLIDVDDLNIKTISGDTPLHLACISRRYDVIQLLVDNGADITALNEREESPLHLACTLNMFPPTNTENVYMESDWLKKQNNYVTQHTPLIKSTFRFLSNKITVQFKNVDGNTPLHLFLSSEAYESVACSYAIKNDLYTQLTKVLVMQQSHGTSLVVPNAKGEYPIHLACKCKNIEVIKLVENTGLTRTTKDGSNVLHYLCQTEWLSMEDFFELVEKYKDVGLHNVNNTGELPLHKLCEKDRREEVLRFMLEKGCNFFSPDNDGNTSLHLLLQRRDSFDDLLYLDESTKILNLPNKDGETPLHYIAKRYWKEMADKILMIYSDSPEILSSILKNACDEFILLLLLNNPDRINFLLKNGVDPAPLYRSHDSFFKNNNETKVPVNLLFIGDSMTGKTTLINSLQKEANHDIELNTNPDRTAGIIPETFESSKYGKVTAYDFAGQREYYAGHEAVMQNILQNLPPIVLLHVKLTLSEKEIMKRIVYWSNFIKNRLNCLKAHLIVVCSHRDLIPNPDERIQTIRNNLSKLFLQKFFESIVVIGMDCRSSDSNEMSQLVESLSGSCSKLSKKGAIKFETHCLFVYLTQHLQEEVAITIHDLFLLRERSLRLSSQYFEIIPDDIHSLMTLCEELASDGLIMLIKNTIIPRRSWIILNKKALLNEIIGKMFAPINFPDYDETLSGTGIVAFSKIRSAFPQYDAKMITSFLCAIEYCFKVTNEHVIRCILSHSLEKFAANDLYYFFPALVTIERPSINWNDSTSCKKSCKFAWVLKCEDSENLLTPKFIQNLILCLIFHSTKIVPLPYHSSEIGVGSISKVWKSGLFWFDEKGVDTIVDVVDTSSKVILFMRCEPSKELELLKHRTSLITFIRSLQKEICPSVIVEEYFIDQSHVDECFSTVEISDRFLVPMRSISVAIKKGNGNGYILTQDGHFKLSEVILFDPYSCMCKYLVEVLLNDDYQCREVSNNCLFALANHLPAKIPLFSRLLCISPTQLAAIKQESDDPITIFLSLLKCWKNNKMSTFGSLVELFNSISIFSTSSGIILHGHNM